MNNNINAVLQNIAGSAAMAANEAGTGAAPENTPGA